MPPQTTNETSNNAPTCSTRAATALTLVAAFLSAALGMWLHHIALYLTSDPLIGGLGIPPTHAAWTTGLGAFIGVAAAPLLAGQLPDRLLKPGIVLGVVLLIAGVLRVATAHAPTHETILVLTILSSIFLMSGASLLFSITLDMLSPKSFSIILAVCCASWWLGVWAFDVIHLRTPGGWHAAFPFYAGDRIPTAPALCHEVSTVSGILALIAGVLTLALVRTPRPKRDFDHPLSFIVAIGALLRPSVVRTLFSSTITLAAAWATWIHWSTASAAAGLSADRVGLLTLIATLAAGIALIATRTLRHTALVAAGLLTLGFVLLWWSIGTAANWGVQAGALALITTGAMFALRAALTTVHEAAPADAGHAAIALACVALLGLAPIAASMVSGRLVAWATSLSMGVHGEWLILAAACLGAGATAFGTVSRRRTMP
ncbi:MAG: hypothetical protein AB7Q00_11110 [Phycisphaerales bacterium]